MSAPHPLFDALPAYLGGKRRLVPKIFGALATVVPPEEWPGQSFLDPFLGAGSVALYAKARGFQVVAGDLARRSVVVGEALIANDSLRLTRADTDGLFRTPAGAYPRLASEEFCPRVFTPGQAAFLDRALFWATRPDRPAAQRALLQLLLVKWVLRCQPMSSLTATDAAAAAAGDYDRVSPARLGHYVRSRGLIAPGAVWRLAEPINRGVFAGTGRVQQIDAVAFLESERGDVVYLDPPYPGTTPYEREYAVLDRLLEGSVRAPSAYSGRRPPLEALFAAAEATPIWLISLNNAVFELDTLTAQVRRFRPHVRAVPIHYPHLRSLATEQKNAQHREFLLIACP